jgi:hypothetical protein
MLPFRMQQAGWMSTPRGLRAAKLVFAVALGAAALSVGGGGGCTVLLETDTNPYKCKVDADCTKYSSNAVCDNARRQCVPRLPFVVMDAGPPPDASDGGGSFTCELSFDNRRVPLEPDGGLRPLPEEP